MCYTKLAVQTPDRRAPAQGHPSLPEGTSRGLTILESAERGDHRWHSPCGGDRGPADGHTPRPPRASTGRERWAYPAKESSFTAAARFRIMPSIERLRVTPWPRTTCTRYNAGAPWGKLATIPSRRERDRPDPTRVAFRERRGHCGAIALGWAGGC